MIVPPVEFSLNAKMQLFQIPIDRQDQTPPDAQVDVVDGNSDLHSLCGLEHWLSGQGWRKIINKTLALYDKNILPRLAFGSHQVLALSAFAMTAENNRVLRVDVACAPWETSLLA